LGRQWNLFLDANAGGDVPTLTKRSKAKEDAVKAKDESAESTAKGSFFSPPPDLLLFLLGSFQRTFLAFASPRARRDGGAKGRRIAPEEGPQG